MNEHRPRLTPEEYELILKFRRGESVEEDLNIVKQFAESKGVDLKNVRTANIRGKQISLGYVNPDFVKSEFDITKVDMDYVLKNTPKVTLNKSGFNVRTSGIFDRLVYTDTHIGMTPDKDGFSLYGGEWNEVEVAIRLARMIQYVIDNRKSRTLVIDDLGDFLDGYGGHTARRGHPLPQNMSDQKAFDVALNFKWQLVSQLSSYFDKIIVNNITNDNHAGAFGYTANSAFKGMIEVSGLAQKVTVINHTEFINHYRIGNNVFIITHGKDKEDLKFGFKPKLDANQAEKIINYIDFHELSSPDVRIEFSKGDSHQLLLDMSSNDKFDYFNYPALSPSSSWVQSNFKKGISGFVFFNYKDTNDYNIQPQYFEWKKRSNKSYEF